MGTKRTLLVLAIIIILAGGGFAVFYFLTPEQYANYTLVFDSEINGIYGENYTLVGDSWTFDPLSMETAYAFTQYLNYTKTGVIITLNLKEQYCLLSSDFFFNVTSNMTIAKIIATIYNSGENVYTESISNNSILTFEYGLFSVDLEIKVEIQLTYD